METLQKDIKDLICDIKNNISDLKAENKRLLHMNESQSDYISLLEKTIQQLKDEIKDKSLLLNENNDSELLAKMMLEEVLLSFGEDVFIGSFNSENQVITEYARTEE